MDPILSWIFVVVFFGTIAFILTREWFERNYIKKLTQGNPSDRQYKPIEPGR